jgi:hypothetical protein
MNTFDTWPESWAVEGFNSNMLLIVTLASRVSKRLNLTLRFWFSGNHIDNRFGPISGNSVFIKRFQNSIDAPRN